MTTTVPARSGTSYVCRSLHAPFFRNEGSKYDEHSIAVDDGFIPRPLARRDYRHVHDAPDRPGHAFKANDQSPDRGPPTIENCLERGAKTGLPKEPERSGDGPSPAGGVRPGRLD